jgi:hypothetical protein
VSGDVNPKQLHRDTKRAMHCVIQRMNNKLRFETYVLMSFGLLSCYVGVA